MNFKSGTFGDPTNPQTLLLYWIKMERLHYPDAGETKKHIEKILQEQQEQMQAQMAEQKRMADAQAQAEQGQQNRTNDNDQQRAIVDVKRQAREDAMKAAQMQGGLYNGDKR